MRARETKYVASAATPGGFPAPGPPEIAFAGRSNVGKSSLINTLTGTKGLARTSSTPGRTQMLNWFHIKPPMGPDLAFVDLPGYGYAKVPTKIREGFGPLIESYVTTRDVLKLVVLLVDVRRGIEDEEHELIGWLSQSARPVLVVVTKSDKVAKNKRFPVVKAIRKELELTRDPLLFSATEAEGIDELWRAILAAVTPPAE
jgi:GTP-binding protein